MNDNILDTTEFNDEEDEGVSFNKGSLKHLKVIPILLRPVVTYPFGVFHQEFADAEWKRILDEFHEKKAVIGVMYCHAEEKGLPPVGRVATSAVIDEIHRATDGKYIVKFVPVNRFFTNEHLETKPILWANVSYYGDHPEDDSIIEPLLKKFLPIINRWGKITRGKMLEEMTLDKLRQDIYLYSFTLFYKNPKLTEHDQLVALWMYKMSLRIEWLLDLLKDALNDNVERLANIHYDAKNN